MIRGWETRGISFHLATANGICKVKILCVVRKCILVSLSVRSWRLLSRNRPLCTVLASDWLVTLHSDA